MPRKISNFLIYMLCVSGWAITFCFVVPGCGSTNTARMMRSFLLPPDEISEDEIEHHRERFQTDRDPEALDWLLANAIDAGMSVNQVEQILAENGQRVFADRKFKTNGGYYRSGDHVYKWNPDNRGRSIYLIFRDDKLVNYNPDEFKDVVPDMPAE